MIYQHKWENAEEIGLPTGKAVCVGRNYVAHAKELNNPIPDAPLLFIKPSTSFQAFNEQLNLSERLGVHHYEAELVLLVGDVITSQSCNPLSCIKGIGLGLDLTLRDVQNELKTLGHPWERAKAYDGSCALTPFFTLRDQADLDNSEYRFWVNNELRQVGKAQLMIHSCSNLLSEISAVFTLMPGDIVMTGTPAGVGALAHGDKLQLQYGRGLKHTSMVICR
jgi:2-keto-4-pentenoate hydratase/2-oxohepta-3-ene-1,7-dioic acid hydratase in catechol pathway